MRPIEINPRPNAITRAASALTYPARGAINLPTPDVRPSISFFDVLDTRQTQYSETPLDVAQISALLWHGCRVRTRLGGPTSHRAAPSAGGLHPIEILVHGLSDVAGLFHYDPERHRLIEIAHNPPAADKLTIEARACLPCNPGTLLWFLAVPQRTEAKYSNADTLILRDTGALIATLCLCGTALRLRPVPLGTHGEPMLSQLTAWSQPVIGVGGLHVAGF